MIVCNPDEETYYQKNKKVILNIQKDYYKNDRERLRYRKYRNLSEEENNEKRKY